MDSSDKFSRWSNPPVDAPAILIVEDDPATLELYRRELSRTYQVLACADEQEALEALRTKDLCAMVLEPALLGGRGWTLLTTIKNSPQGHDIPIILCSTLDKRKRGLELGAAACLVKPVLPTTLLETVQRVTEPAPGKFPVRS
jgi:DNA-binding response OmpR family regulator